MPHLLDLYCGTKSVSNAFAEYDWKTTTVDIDPACKPDICKNVLKLTKADLPDDIDAIWASPLCTHYSRARTTAKTPRDLEGSDKLVAKVLEIASWFNAPYFIENPDGLLKTRPVVEGIPMRLVDYCQYKDERWKPRYRKRTCIWTNTDWMPERALCNPFKCPCCDADGKHLDQAQRAGKRGAGKGNTLAQLYAIPPALPEEIASFLDWYLLGFFAPPLYMLARPEYD